MVGAGEEELFFDFALFFWLCFSVLRVSRRESPLHGVSG
jgi:hypothetical protein